MAIAKVELLPSSASMLVGLIHDWLPLTLLAALVGKLGPVETLPPGSRNPPIGHLGGAVLTCALIGRNRRAISNGIPASMFSSNCSLTTHSVLHHGQTICPQRWQ